MDVQDTLYGLQHERGEADWSNGLPGTIAAHACLKTTRTRYLECGTYSEEMQPHSCCFCLMTGIMLFDREGIYAEKLFIAKSISFSVIIDLTFSLASGKSKPI